MSSRLRALPAVEADLPFTINMTADHATPARLEAELPPEPWTRAHLMALVAAQALGAVVLAGAWLAVSDELVFTRQVPHLDLALVGLMAGGVANVLWIAHGRTAVRRRKADFLRRVGIVLPGTGAGDGGPAAAPATDGSALQLVAAPRMTRYHRPDCPLLDGKPVQPVSGPEQTMRTPCGLCQPTGAGGAGTEVGRA